MQVGFAQKTITPVAAMPMAGYDKRRVTFEGVHDDVYAKCLLLNEDGEVITIMSLDLLGIDEKLTDAVIEALAAYDESISDDRMFICATHTHSGPSGIFKEKTDFNEGYYRFLIESCKEIYLAAKKDFRPGVLQITSTNIDNVASVRNAISPQVKQVKAQVMKFVRDDGYILLVNLPCHLTVLDENNVFISKDLLYGLELGLNDAGIKRHIFLNSAAGNVSTRYFKTKASFAEAERLGREIAQSIIKTDLSFETISNSSIFTEKRKVLLKYKKNYSTEEKESIKYKIRSLLEKVGDSPLRRNYESSLLVLERPDRDIKNLPNIVFSEDASFKEISVRLAKIGKISIACVPLEVDLLIGQKISDIVDPSGNGSLIFGYCGGYSGYIVGSETGPYDYENIACPYESDSEWKLLEAFDYLSGKAVCNSNND
jgi:hypothetical protein